MKIPRDVYGRDFVNHLVRRWDFREERQTGSHIILASVEPVFHVSIPAHKPLKTGTLSDLLRFIADRKQVTVEELLHKL